MRRVTERRSPIRFKLWVQRSFMQFRIIDYDTGNALSSVWSLEKLRSDDIPAVKSHDCDSSLPRRSGVKGLFLVTFPSHESNIAPK